MIIVKFVAGLVGALIVAVLVVRPAHSAHESAIRASMKADLRNLVTAQQSFFSDSARYARSIEELGDERFVSSPNVTISIAQAGDSAWKGAARGEDTASTCEISVAPPADPLDAQPVCDPEKINRWTFIWDR